MLKKKLFPAMAAVACAVFPICGQTTSVFTTGLTSPNKIINAADGSMLVAESGTSAPNSGRISVLDRTTGSRHTLISGLPSGVSNLGGSPEPDGTTAVFLRGNILYVVSGVGDACINVGPGLELPNPAGASSPIFDSVMEVSLPGGYANLASGFALTLSDQTAIATGESIGLTNAEGKKAVVRIVANLPDYRPEPRPSAPSNVRASHLFAIEMFQKDLYVVDAAFNSIHKINISTGDTSTFITFPNRPNPLFPTLGGPFIEAVPDSVHRVGNTLIVSLLTGFPFVPGQAEVRAVGLKSGVNDGLIPNLTSTIDVMKVSAVSSKSMDSGDEDAFYTLEFSTNMLQGSPGRLRYYAEPGAAPINVATTLVTPTSMVRNAETGEIFITNIGPGTVTKVSFP